MPRENGLKLEKKSRVAGSRNLCIALLLALIAGTSSCGGSGGGGGPANNSGGGSPNAGGSPAPDTTVSSITVTPGALLLTAAGEERLLTAQAYNAAGEAIDATIEWSSNDINSVSVDSNGRAVAETSAGSALITASAGGIDSLPILALVALPAVDSVLVSDEQFIGDPVPVDPDAEFDIGFRYSVLVTNDVDTEVGDILIASGGTPVAGAVVEVTDGGDGTSTITLEVVPIDEVFTSLVIDEEFDISQATLVVDEEVGEYYDVSLREDGSYALEPIPGIEIPEPETQAIASAGRLSSSGNDYPQTAEANAAQQVQFGPFKCSFVSTFPLKVSAGLPTFYVIPSLTPKISFDSLTGGLEEMSAKGTVTVLADLALSTKLELQGKVECAAELFTIYIPLSGAAAAYILPMIEFSGGFALGGKFDVSQLDLKVDVEMMGETSMGVLCSNASLAICVPITDGDYDVTLTDFDAGLPNGYISGDFSPFVQLFGKASYGIALPVLLNLYKLKFVETKFGAKVNLDLDTVEEQIRRSQNASYNLSLDGEIGTGSTLTTTIETASKLLKIRGIQLKSKLFSVPVDESPESGFFVIDKQDPAIGDNVEFTLGIAKPTVDFFNKYQIGKVNLYHVADPSNPVPNLIASTTPGNTSQSEFRIPWSVNLRGGKVYASVVSDPFLLPLSQFGLHELVVDDVDLGFSCAQDFRPIDSGDVWEGKFSGMAPTVNGPVSFVDYPLNLRELRPNGSPNEYIGRADTAAIVSSSGSGAVNISVSGVIMQPSEGGGVDLMLSIPPNDGRTCIYTHLGQSGVGTCAPLTSYSIQLTGTAEVIDASVPDFQGCNLSLYGPNDWNGDFYFLRNEWE